MSNVIGKGNNDLVDRLAYPHLVKLQRFIPRTVTPNSISWTGFFSVVIATSTLMLVKHPVALLVFVVFILAYSALDCLDGIHARMTGQTSRFGEFLDHFLDQLSSLLVWFSLLLRFDLFTPIYVFIVLSVMTINTLAFVYRALSGHLYVGALGPTTNLVALCIGFIAIFVFDDPVLFTIRTANPDVMRVLVAQNVSSITIAKLALLTPLLSLWYSFYMFYGLAKQYVRETEAAEARKVEAESSPDRRAS